MQLSFIVSASLDAATDGRLSRLLSSIEVSTVTCPSLEIADCRVVCVARGWTPGARQLLLSQFDGMNVTLLDAPALFSLSESRNLAIAWLLNDGRRSLPDFVAFPDDDCWYNETTFEALLAAIAHVGDYDTVISGCYGPSEASIDRHRFPARRGSLDVGAAIRQTSSVTLFVPVATVVRVGRFSPILGAGAPAHAGEDLDYVIRILKTGGRIFYDPSVVVGHQYDGRSNGYVGPGLVVLASHLPDFPRLFAQTVRSSIGALRRSSRPTGSSIVYNMRFAPWRLVRPLRRERSRLSVMDEDSPLRASRQCNDS